MTDRWLGEEASEFDQEALIYEAGQNEENDGEKRERA
jgi:hypothetical protein